MFTGMTTGPPCTRSAERVEGDVEFFFRTYIPRRIKRSDLIRNFSVLGKHLLLPTNTPQTTTSQGPSQTTKLNSLSFKAIKIPPTPDHAYF